VRTGHKSRLGSVIASRVLTQMGPQLQQIIVSIGRPRRRSKAEWECPFLVDGLEGSAVQTAGGVDSMQALQMAIEGVRVNLERSGHRFVWLERETGSEIPRYVPTQYGPRFEARLNRMIEYQAKRFWESKLKGRQANLAALEADVKLRKDILIRLEAALERRKKATANWAAELKDWKPNQRQRP
jgi:hypothetical protein